MPLSITPPLPGTDPTVIPAETSGGALPSGSGPDGVPEPMQPVDPLSGSAPGVPAPPPPNGVPDASQPMPTGLPGQAGAGQPPGGAPGLGAPAGASAPPGAPPPPPPPAPLGTPGNIACAVADPNSQTAAQCAAATQPAAPGMALPTKVAGAHQTRKQGEEGIKAAAIVDAFVASARGRDPGRPDARNKHANAQAYVGTPMGMGLQAMRSMGPPPVPEVMRPRGPGAAPTTNFAAGGMGTALAHRPLFNGLSAMQGKPMLPGVRGPNGLLGKPGLSIAPRGMQGIGMTSPAHKLAAMIIRNHEKKAKDTGADAGKTGQKEAQYGPAMSAARSCAVCANFDGRNQCAVVAGPIDPGGTSALFTPRPELAAVDTGRVEHQMAAMPMPAGTKQGAAPFAVHPDLHRILMAQRGYALHPGEDLASMRPGTHWRRHLGFDELDDVETLMEAEHAAGRPIADEDWRRARSLGQLHRLYTQTRAGAHKTPVKQGAAELPALPSDQITALLEKLGVRCPPQRKRLKPFMPSRGRFRRRKQAAIEKCAVPVSPLVLALLSSIGGGVAGAVKAPHHHKEEGFFRGASRGRAGVGSAILGGGLGAVTGMGLDAELNADMTVPLAAAGAGLGGYAGNAAMGWAMDRPSWHPKHKQYHPSGVAHPKKLRAALAAVPLGFGAIPMSTLYAKQLAGPLSGRFSSGHSDARDAQDVVDRVLGKGKVPVVGVPGLANAGFVAPEHVFDLPGRLTSETAPHGGIAWDEDMRFGPGIAAHEAGHAANYESHPALQHAAQHFSRTMQIPTALSTVAAPLIPSKKWARRTALLGSALQVPQLAEELAASHRGGMGLSSGHHGLEGLGQYLSAFTGIPTYALHTAMPLLAYGAANLMGRWRGDQPHAAVPHLRVVHPDHRRGRDADSDGRRNESHRKAAALVKCACVGSVMCAACRAKKKPYREVRPERREGDARFAWRGRGARDVTDDPGYEKYVRKTAALTALDAVLHRRLP